MAIVCTAERRRPGVPTYVASFSATNASGTNDYDAIDAPAADSGLRIVIVGLTLTTNANTVVTLKSDTTAKLSANLYVYGQVFDHKPYGLLELDAEEKLAVSLTGASVTVHGWFEYLLEEA